MTTFAMIVLTVFTVLGSMLLGWLARWYWSGNRDEGLGASYSLADKTDSVERGAGAIGTVAAGTATMHHLSRDEDRSVAQTNSRDAGSDNEGSADGSATSGSIREGGALSGNDATEGMSAGGRTAAPSEPSGLGNSTNPTSETNSGEAFSGSVGENTAAAARFAGVEDISARAPDPSTDSAAQTPNVASTDDSAESSGVAASANTASQSGDGTKASSIAAAASGSVSTPSDAAGRESGMDASTTSVRSGHSEKADDTASGNKSNAGGGGSATSDHGNARDLHGGDERTSDSPDAMQVRAHSQNGRSSSAEPNTDSGSGADTSSIKSDPSTSAAHDDAQSNRSNGDVSENMPSAGAAQGGKDQTETVSTSKAGTAALGAVGTGVGRSTGRGGETTAADIDTRAELKAAQAEARQLRVRLGLDADEVSGFDENASLEEQLEAAQLETRNLRQRLWDEDGKTEGNAAKPASFGSFGEHLPEELEAERLIAAGKIPESPSTHMEAPNPGFDPNDLTKISGVGKPTEARLNRNGIYYYDQIANFTAADLAWADTTMNLNGRVVSDRWIPQAKRLAKGSDASASVERAPSEAETNVGDVAAPANLLSAPIEGRIPDDLTRIKGVGEKLQEQLNARGIFYFDQIAGFTESDQVWANKTLGFAGRVERDEWIAQARELIAAGSDEQAEGRGARLSLLADAERLMTAEDVDDIPGEMSASETEAMRMIESGEFVADDSNKPKGLLDAAPAGPEDDLKLINGVGPKLEDLLHSLGIYQFKQIAEFSASDIAWVDSKLRFKGRIIRDRWVDQSKRIANPTEAMTRASQEQPRSA